MIETQKVVNGMIVTICNYDYYQTPDNYKIRSLERGGGRSGKSAEGSAGAEQKQEGNNNDKKKRNISSNDEGERAERKRLLADFERFYDIYPRHTQRAVAEKRWITLSPPPEQVKKIIAALKAQIASGDMDPAKKEKKFIPHPATWLNQRRWEDEIGLEQGSVTKPRQVFCELCNQYHFQEEKCPPI